MAKTDILMPQMGESITEGTLTKWHKKVGDRVAREEILLEISTDKVDTEIPSPAAGIVVEILAKEGDTVAINTVIARVDSEGSAAVSASAATQAVATPPPPPVGQASASSAAAGVSLHVAAPAVAAAVPVQKVAGGSDAARVAASPLVRKMAADQGVNLSTVPGSGLGGKINKQDLLNYLEGKAQASPIIRDAIATVAVPVVTASPQHIQETGGAMTGVVDGVRVERVPMSPMRRKIADHMVMSKHTSPHVTSVIEVDLQKIVDLRAKAKNAFEAKNGFKLTFMPFFMHAALEAIKAVPIANASVDGTTIVYKKDVNLGIAVAMDSGLIVPVIKHAAEKSFIGLGRDLNDLAERARSKKLTPDDVRGGTFSISNFGGFGTIIGQPIINQPQVAIMGIGAMTKKPVVVNDAIAIRTMCYVVLSFDHRVLDGSDSGKFLSTVKDTLENWSIPVG